MKKIYLISIFVILYTLYFILNTSVANAEGASLRLTPSLIEIKTQAPNEIENPLIIENTGNSSIRLNLDLKSFKPSESKNGQIEYISEIPNFRGFIIKVFNNDLEVKELTLGPRQKKNLKLKISIPDQPANILTNTDYYFSVLFTTIPESITNTEPGSIRSFINAGVASNILLSVEYKTQDGFIKSPATGSIEKFSVPKNIQSGPVPFTILVTNTGPHFISPSGIILIKNMFGQIVGKVDIDSANILSNSSRYLQNSDWKEKFLLGFYSADLSIKLSDNGPILTKNLKFFVFPFQLMVNLSLAFIVIAIIYSRVKRRL